jgi:Circadian oscillating protein COP23
MKALILSTLLIAESIALVGVRSTPADATLTVRFYCGQSFDPDLNKITPTTFVATSARTESIALIRWKSSFGKYSPQARCTVVSSKFQTAWASGNLKFVKAGVSNENGQGIVCGTADRQQQCDDSNMLFTLRNHQDAQSVIQSILNIRGGRVGQPVGQSAGSDSIVDLEQLTK